MRQRRPRNPKVIANYTIKAAMRRNRLKMTEGMNMQQAAELLAAKLGLKIDGPINKMTVATAIRGSLAPDLNTRWDPKQFDADHVDLERRIKEFYKSWEWYNLSYQVKLDRGRRCECCGATPPQVRIVTDHIKPLRRYWNLRLDPQNLQVLCDECNKGKGSMDETDFRPGPRNLPINDAEIDAAKTARGGFTRATLAQWGVPWPPPAGWRRALINRAAALERKDNIPITK